MKLAITFAATVQRWRLFANRRLLLTFEITKGFCHSYNMPDPIEGIAVLGNSKTYGEYLVVLRIRLNQTESQLKTELLRLNRTCILESRGCSTHEQAERQSVY